MLLVELLGRVAANDLTQTGGIRLGLRAFLVCTA